MIRIELPPVILPRLRLHWHSAHLQFSRRSRAVREYANRTAAVSAAWWRHASGKTVASLSLRHRMRVRTVVRLSTQLATFEERYEDLVDLLCWAAKDGIHTDRDARYAALRDWMQANYRALRPRLRPYWATGENPVAGDPFEAIFVHACVDEVINAATCIDNMMRARAALDAYRTALEAQRPIA